jgi:hypothetical protein
MTRAAQLRQQIESALAGRIPAALSPRPRSSTQLLSCGLPEADALLGGGLPAGTIAELTGPASSGRTTFALATLAELTRRGHACACVDPCDALDPFSAAALGADLRRLLWVRGTSGPVAGRRQHIARLEQGLRAADLLLNAGGFRALLLDLAGLGHEQVRRVPLATWYRFRLQAEKSRTLLLLLTSETQEHSHGYAQSCAAVSLRFLPAQPEWRRATPQSLPLLAGLRYRLHLRRGRTLEHSNEPACKPPAPAGEEAVWSSAAAWIA